MCLNQLSEVQKRSYRRIPIACKVLKLQKTKPAIKLAGFCVLREDEDKWSYNEAVYRKIL